MTQDERFPNSYIAAGLRSALGKEWPFAQIQSERKLELECLPRSLPFYELHRGLYTMTMAVFISQPNSSSAG